MDEEKTVTVLGKVEQNKSGPGKTEQEGLISIIAILCTLQTQQSRLKGRLLKKACLSSFEFRIYIFFRVMRSIVHKLQVTIFPQRV